MSKKLKHYEEQVFVPAKVEEVFLLADDHLKFSSHMSKNSWMMGGSKMFVDLDSDGGKKVGSHIKLKGKVLGFDLYLDEVVTVHKPPYKKVWKTVGNLNLLVVGHYTMGFEVSTTEGGSLFKVFIDYELPTGPSKVTGLLFGKIYAKWCVNQMLIGVKNHFLDS